jgi:hypothetical protein
MTAVCTSYRWFGRNHEIAEGRCLDGGIAKQLEVMAQQVVGFAHMRAAACDRNIPSATI